MSIIADIEAAVPALHRYARSLVQHRHDADDLVQDCLERALSRLPLDHDQKPDRLQDPAQNRTAAVLPWLFTILHNLSVSRWRTLRRRGHTVDLEEAGLSVPASQDAALSRRDLLRGFERLSPEHRQVLLLVSVEGLDYRQAATILNVPLGTVMSRLSRARDALRDHMNGVERPRLRQVK